MTNNLKLIESEHEAWDSDHTRGVENASSEVLRDIVEGLSLHIPSFPNTDIDEQRLKIAKSVLKLREYHEYHSEWGR